MLRVTIELVPFGEEKNTEVISEICIANTGDGDSSQANYQAAGYVIEQDGSIELVAGEVNNFSRTDGVLALVKDVLRSRHSRVEDIELGSKLLLKTKKEMSNE